MELLVSIAIGVLLGTATLPWMRTLTGAKRADVPSMLLHVAGLTCLWPLLLLMMIPLAIKAYRNAWRDLIRAHQMLKHEPPVDELAEADRAAAETRRTVRETFIKSK